MAWLRTVTRGRTKMAANVPELPQAFLLSTDAVDDNVRMLLLRHRIHHVVVVGCTVPDDLTSAATKLGLPITETEAMSPDETPPPRSVLIASDAQLEVLSDQFKQAGVYCIMIR